MPSFKAIIQKFADKGEKTGWTYVEVPQDVLLKLKLKDRKEFRIKGVIDDVKVEKLAVYPIGDGVFIIALNGTLRKQLGKKEGAAVSLKIEKDTGGSVQSAELAACLDDDPVANEAFKKQLLSHRNYFHRYVATAKGQATKAERILNVINAMYKGQNFGEMVRSLKKEK